MDLSLQTSQPLTMEPVPWCPPLLGEGDGGLPLVAWECPSLISPPLWVPPSVPHPLPHLSLEEALCITTTSTWVELPPDKQTVSCGGGWVLFLQAPLHPRDPHLLFIISGDFTVSGALPPQSCSPPPTGYPVCFC